MAHIYIHIPFCRQACYYCNFHFLVSKKHQLNFVEALKNEIELTIEYFSLDEKTSEIETIYFGGGTPSFLPTSYIEQLLNHLSKFYNISRNAEITLEANPDDLTKTKIEELQKLPINRLSIGIQSFNEEDLVYLNRSHNSQTGINAILNVQDSGFSNLNVDLIFGIPTSTNKIWEKNLETYAKLDIPHLSAYSLTIEEKTPLDVFIKKQKVKNVDETKSAEQFEMLMDFMNNNGYEQYEISNYCKDKKYSKHNVAYWQNKAYLGLGPAAHSFNINSRQWNISNTTTYIKNLLQNKLTFEKEILGIKDRYNEFIFTGLRTIWGVDSAMINHIFGKKYDEYFLEKIEPYIKNENISKIESKYMLTNKGKLFADAIASDCFFID